MTEWDHNPELWDFPCQFPLKVMGTACDDFEAKVIEAVQIHAPNDYYPKTRPSKNGKYLSVTVVVELQSKEHLENIYAVVNAVPEVKIIL